MSRQTRRAQLAVLLGAIPAAQFIYVISAKKNTDMEKLLTAIEFMALAALFFLVVVTVVEYIKKNWWR